MLSVMSPEFLASVSAIIPTVILAFTVLFLWRRRQEMVRFEASHRARTEAIRKGNCQTDDYQGTTNPNHTDAGFSTTCTQCHNTTTWLGATFTHIASFPLTNAHANRACTACHTTPGVYSGLTNDCASCHLDDYQRTSNHARLGYPTSCTLCHTPTLWTNATFTHPRINRGGHSSLSCANCHTVPAATPAFSCTHCHEHDRTSTDRDHREVQGYQYLSSACYNCHQR